MLLSLLPLIFAALVGVADGVKMAAEGKTWQQYEQELKVKHQDDAKLEAAEKAAYKKLIEQNSR